MAAGFLRMRTVVEPSLVGLAVNAFVTLSVNPTQLGQAGELLAAHPAVLMISATTGDRNLCGEIALESDAALYEFLSGTIGQLPGLQHADVAVALRSVKRAGMILPPAPRPRGDPPGPPALMPHSLPDRPRPGRERCRLEDGEGILTDPSGPRRRSGRAWPPWRPRSAGKPVPPPGPPR